MPLSSVQKGAIGQYAFLCTAMATGNGQVEAYTPAADNEGRDAEIRRHLKASPGISIQVKVSFFSNRIGNGHDKYLTIRFFLTKKHVQTDPRLWYFFAYYDRKELRFHDPVFLIPSDVFHKMARRGVANGRVWFSIMANLGPLSNDRWSQFRVTPKDLGKRLLKIIDDAPLTATSRSMTLPPDSVWLGRAKRRPLSAGRDRAA